MAVDVFFRTAVSIDLVMFTMIEQQMHVLLRKSTEPPFEGMATLPGQLVFPNVDTDTAIASYLHELTGRNDVYHRQLRAFTAIDRHPLGRVITIPYYAVIDAPSVELPEAYFWCHITKVPELAFDHNAIYAEGFETLQKGLRRKPVAFNLLPEKFTLAELQAVFEQGYGRTLDTRNFRRKVQASGLLTALDEKRHTTGLIGKPPQLFSFNHEAFEVKRESSIGYFF